MFLERLNSSNGKFHSNLSLLFPIKTTSHQLNGPNQQTHTFKEREMAMYFNTNILLLVFLAITGILFSGNNNNMVVGDDCQGDMQGLVAQCAMYVQKGMPKMNPSQQCCSVIQKADMPCVCQHVTKDVEKIIDMEKVIFVARYCGRPVAPGTTCGSKKLLKLFYIYIYIYEPILHNLCVPFIPHMVIGNELCVYVFCLAMSWQISISLD